MNNITELGLPVSEIPENGSKGFSHNDLLLFAVKKNGNIFVYRNSCPHLGIALQWVDDQFLDQSNSMIQCANHSALFVIEDGLCVSGPCSGRTLTAVAFTEVDGVIYPRIDS